MKLTGFLFTSLDIASLVTAHEMEGTVVAIAHPHPFPLLRDSEEHDLDAKADHACINNEEKPPCLCLHAPRSHQPERLSADISVLGTERFGAFRFCSAVSKRFCKCTVPYGTGAEISTSQC